MCVLFAGLSWVMQLDVNMILVGEQLKLIDLGVSRTHSQLEVVGSEPLCSVASGRDRMWRTARPFTVSCRVAIVPC